MGGAIWGGAAGAERLSGRGFCHPRRGGAALGSLFVFVIVDTPGDDDERAGRLSVPA